MTSHHPNCLPKALFPNTVTLGVWASTYEFGRETHSVHIDETILSHKEQLRIPALWILDESQNVQLCEGILT